ncbi:MAG: DUF2808 domain-containing protein [Nodosilinea sp.]
MKSTLQTLKITTFTLGLLSSLATLPGHAAQFSDGRVLFDRPPTLIEVTTFDQTPAVSGRYHFVIEVPANAGEPLASLVITPRDLAKRVSFNVEASTAHLGMAYGNGPAVALASSTNTEAESNQVRVVFAEPIQPGETVTLILKTVRNPSAGVYLFGVTGYPTGDSGVGQFLGYGRVHIYDSTN